MLAVATRGTPSGQSSTERQWCNLPVDKQNPTCLTDDETGRRLRLRAAQVKLALQPENQDAGGRGVAQDRAFGAESAYTSSRPSRSFAARADAVLEESSVEHEGRTRVGPTRSDANATAYSIDGNAGDGAFG